jgi:hypothetical protein
MGVVLLMHPPFASHDVENDQLIKVETPASTTWHGEIVLFGLISGHHTRNLPFKLGVGVLTLSTVGMRCEKLDQPVHSWHST